MTQGIGVATGLQDSFDWRSVAISAVSAPLAKGLMDNVVGPNLLSADSSAFTRNLAQSVTGGLTSAAVRAAFGGKIDMVAVLTDAFANAVGNSIVDGVSAPTPVTPTSPSPDDPGLAEIQVTAQPMLEPIDITAERMLEPIEVTAQRMSETYTVRTGDALERIARAHGMGPEGAAAIAAASGIDVADVIRPGQALVIPGSYDALAAKTDYGSYLAEVNATAANAEDPADPNSFSSVTAALQRLIDPVTGRRIGPTVENAIARGLLHPEPRFPVATNAEMRAWDPAASAAAEARRQLAGDGIGSIFMNPMGAFGYLLGRAQGTEEFALQSAQLFGAFGDTLLAAMGGTPLGQVGVQSSQGTALATHQEPTALRAARFADLVNSNRAWTWADVDSTLTTADRRLIRDFARDASLIPTVPTDPLTGYADFSSVALRQGQLPEDNWMLRDRAQFRYLNDVIGGQPLGTTWHHDITPGSMQLVPLGIHNVTNHVGGRTIWSSGPR